MNPEPEPVYTADRTLRRQQCDEAGADIVPPRMDQCVTGEMPGAVCLGLGINNAFCPSKNGSADCCASPG